MLVEDHAKSRSAVRVAEPHFEVFLEFRKAPYQQRYELLCKRLVVEKLYTNAAVITFSREGGLRGEFTEVSEEVSLRREGECVEDGARAAAFASDRCPTLRPFPYTATALASHLFFGSRTSK